MPAYAFWALLYSEGLNWKKEKKSTSLSFLSFKAEEQVISV